MKFLENSLEKLARILSRQYHVDVVFKGNQAYTDGKRINLPYFPEINEELYLELNGYLDHEVGHVKFTQFEEVRHVISAYHKEMLNVVEDVRIEREMIREYPGTKFHLDSLNNKLQSKLEETWFSRPWTIRFLISLHRVMEGQSLVEDREVKKYLALCEEEIKQLNYAQNTKQLRVLTEAIVKKLAKEIKQEKEEEKKSEKGESDSKEKSESSGSSKGEKSSKGKKEEKENEESESSCEGEKSEDKKEKSNSASGGNKEEKEKQEEKSSGEAKAPEKKMTKKEKEMKEKAEKLLESKNEKDFQEFEIDVHRMINNKIEQAIEEAKSVEAERGYSYSRSGKKVSIPLTTEFDSEENLSGKDNNYSFMKRSVKPYVNTLKNKLEKIFRSVENAQWKSEKEQGLINARSLSNLVSNQNYRTPFKRLEKNETDKVAVSILLDLSGSMSGSKVETAKLAATAMAEALQGLNINFEVLGFSTKYGNGGRNNSGIDMSRFNRINEALDHKIFKDFSSKKLSGISLAKSSMNNNDGESVMWAAKRLSQRQEKRKVLIVLSDGMPAGEGDSSVLQNDLRYKIGKIDKFGIETVGIGIQTDAVKHFYKDYVVVNNLKDLTTGALTKLSSILLKGIRK